MYKIVTEFHIVAITRLNAIYDFDLNESPIDPSVHKAPWTSRIDDDDDDDYDTVASKRESW